MSELSKAIERAKYIRSNFDLDESDKRVIDQVIEAAKSYLLSRQAMKELPKWLPTDTEEGVKDYFPMPPKSRKRVRLVPIDDEEGGKE